MKFLIYRKTEEGYVEKPGSYEAGAKDDKSKVSANSLTLEAFLFLNNP